MSRHALAHRQRTLAALAEQAGAADSQVRANANEYELMLFKLDEDRRRLKAVQSTERKIELKRELLPAYAAWCEGVIESRSPRQDDVFMTILLWKIDVGDFEHALPMAAHAIEHGMEMPDRFARTTACLIAEEMAETAFKAAGDELAAYAENLAECLQLTGEQDMPDEVLAKLHKARAYALLAVAEQPPETRTLSCIELWQDALENLNRALQLNSKAGVKKDIERLEREIKKAQDTAGTPA